MKKTEKSKKTSPVAPSSDTVIPVGSKGYVGILVFLWFLVLYILTMVLGMSGGAGDTAGGFLIVTSPFFIAAIVMLIFQIRYMKQNRIRFSPKKIAGSIGAWFARMLFPVQKRFSFDADDGSNVSRKLTDFRREYAAFFAGDPPGTNTTQSYRNRLSLHRKRLDGRGITLTVSQRRRAFEKEPAVSLGRFPDGHFFYSRAKEYVWGSRSFTQNGRTLFHDKKLLCADYDFIGVMPADSAETRLFRCPGCGAVSDAETLLSGCPYCAKKFLIEELSDRVCSLTQYRSPDAETRLAGLHITAFTNRLAFLAAVLQAIGMGSTLKEVYFDGAASPTEIPFGIVLTVFSVAFAFLLAFVIYKTLLAPLRIFIYWLYRTMRRDRRLAEEIAKQNRRTAAAVQKTDPDFSVISLFSGVRNKLDVLHFADTQAQVGVFSTVPLTDYLPRYRDIIDCSHDTMSLDSVVRDGEYYNVKITAEMTLLFHDGKKTRREKEQVTLTLRRRVTVDRRNPFGIHSPVCPHCGASVDLLLGNTCAYCGNALNFMNVDWCITEYRSSIAG